MDYIIFWTGLILTIIGSFFIANSICQKGWKEKIPVAKLVTFLGLFLFSFVGIGLCVIAAMAVSFGR